MGTRDERPGGGGAAMYCIDARGNPARSGPAQVQPMWEGASTLNGLAWSPEPHTLYSADTPTHRIEARDWSAVDNRLGPARTLHQFPRKPALWKPGESGYGGYGGRPDGAAVDADGNYWCAMFVTTARHGRPDAELERTPLAGRVLVLEAPVAVPGLGVNAFEEAEWTGDSDV